MNMKLLLISLCTSCIMAMASAQPQHGGPSGKPQDNTPEKIASRRTDDMKSRIGLTDKQYKKVYKMNLKEEKAREKNRKQNGDGFMGQEGMPQGKHHEGGNGKPDGDRPQGGPGGFGQGHEGGRPPMGGGPGGFGHGGGRPSGDFGQGGPGGHGSPGHNGPDASMTKDPDSAKYIQKADKKLKKILTSEQYAKWRKIHPLELW